MKTLKGIVLTAVLGSAALIGSGCDDKVVVVHPQKPRPVVVVPAHPHPRPTVVVAPRPAPRRVVIHR